MTRSFTRRPVTNLAPDDPLFHSDHARPRSRRELLRQGFLSGAGMALFPSVFSLFAQPRSALAAVAGDVEALAPSCTLGSLSLSKVPFLCFDLAGGANIAGSNVLVGGAGGQLDLLSAAGYSRLGLPGGMLPTATEFVNSELGLAFHSDSGFLRGILEKLSPQNRAQVNGSVMPARSENDTANNPHNPMYALARYALAQLGDDGALNFDVRNPAPWGQLMALIGSRPSDSGGNSMASPLLTIPEIRPTKVDSAGDARGLVNTGTLSTLLPSQDAAQVLEAMARISDDKLRRVTIGNATRELLRCGYVRAADIAGTFSDPGALDPFADEDIIGGGTPIFSPTELQSDREFAKTASIMKLVIEGRAGAGCITLGGYDYHTGDRATGERRDLRAGRCIGACLEYAARKRVPLMLYVFSDGSVDSNGTLDNSADGRGKGVWTSDNSSTSAAFFLVYNPNGTPQLRAANSDEAARKQQLGYMRSEGTVETASSPAANNVNLLVETIVLNYMALHGQEAAFPLLFPDHGLGAADRLDRLIAFQPIIS